MRAWQQALSEVEALEALPFDALLVGDMARQAERAGAARPVRFYTPSFKAYASSEIESCSSNSWPAVSITGGACKLQCDHCKAKILDSMIPATTPDDLWRVANEQVARGAVGMLLSGGSNHRDEVEYGPFLPTVERIKARFPDFRIAIHTGLLERNMAQRIEQAGVDVAMLDIIGAEETIRHVYHLKRPVEDFAKSLQYLTETSLKVVPHIVIGLHYGQLLGERRALQIVAEHVPSALVLVVIMPFYASPKRPFAVPASDEVGRFFLEARAAVPDVPVLLGCARPPGSARQQIDAYAVMAGLDGIAHPAEGVVELAARLGRDVRVTPACCSVAIGTEVLDDEEGVDAALSVDLQRFIERERLSRHAGALRGIRVVAGSGGLP